MNDIDSSLTNTNDLMLTDILLFGKASLDTSANTHCKYNEIFHYLNELGKMFSIGKNGILNPL